MIRVRGHKKNKIIALCLGDGCGLGNMLQALPAVQALHDAGHTCDLFLSGCMYAGIADVVRGQPYVRDIYENTCESREKQYDVCIVSFLSDHRVDAAKIYLKLKKDWEIRSEYEEYCRVARKLGAREFQAPRLNSSERDFSLQPLSVLIHAGCADRKYWERKKWTHYTELSNLLAKDGCHMYCCGTVNEIIEHPKVLAYNNLSIQETVSLIKQCDLFLSNDSGLMHLAAALRKKQIAIFTATSDKKSAPYYNPHARVIKPQLACYPCYGKEKEWNQCVSWKCRDSITVDEVYDLARIMLQKDQNGAAAASS